MRRRSQSIDRLLAQLRDDVPEVRRTAVEALERLNLDRSRPPRPPERQIDQVFRALATLLRQDPEPTVRREVAYAFSCWFQPRAPAALIPVLEDVGEQPLIRGQAAEGIGKVLDVYFGSAAQRARAIAALRRGLSDPLAEVRFWCIYSLGSMKATEARAEIEHIAATDERLCPYMWRVSHEAEDVLTYWDTGSWPPRAFDPAAQAHPRI